MMEETTHPAEHHAPAVVLIGGSAGALEVVSQLLGALPGDYATPIVVVIHLPRHRPSSLSEALSRTCRLPLREAQDKEPLAAGTVYLAPPDYHLLIDPGPSFALSVDEPVNFSRPSIDVLFESAADVVGAGCAGIIVSGANPDGARGLRAIHASGGLAIVQAPDDAEQRAMPEAAAAMTPDARVLSSQGIRQWLQQLSMAPTPSGRGAP